MANILIATFGSLGDLHPKIAIGLELKKRGHNVTFAVMEFYREKIEMLGFYFRPLAPHLDPDDRDLARELMDKNKGTERIIRDLIMPNLRQMYENLTDAASHADIMITGEVVYAAKSVTEKTGIKWVTTTLAPVSFMSAYDPPVPAPAPQFENLRFLGPAFHRYFFKFLRWHIREWYEPYREFRRGLDLDDADDPIFGEKYSPLLHLVLFSKVLGQRQPDWPAHALQTGFCFYDGKDDLGKVPEGLGEFLDSGEPPVVFTLGSAAVMDAGNFFDESLQAAAGLKRRALLIYGVYNEPPDGADFEVTNFGDGYLFRHKLTGIEAAAFQYAPYSQVFRLAACVVHQGGVGTTAQVLSAGVPQLFMPFSHDQPDNAARCRRLGVAEVITREIYQAETAAETLRKILGTPAYAEKARAISKIVAAEKGTEHACDAIEAALSK